MSFNIKMHVTLLDPKPNHILIEEEEELRATIAKVTKENEELHQKLCKAATDKDKFKYRVGKRNKELSESYGNIFKEKERSIRLWMV